MKKTLTVALPGREYQIEIQRGLLDQAGERCRALLPRARKLAVVTDSNVLPLYLERTADSLKRAGFQAPSPPERRPSVRNSWSCCGKK